MLSTMFRDPAFVRLSRDMDRFFEAATPRLLVEPAGAGTNRWPALNVWREGEAFVAEAELPGMSIGDVELLVTEDALTIRGERRREVPEGATVLRTERPALRFERTIRLPQGLDADGGTASLRDGVLRVTLPIAEAARPKRIEVRAIEGGSRRGELPAGESGGA